MPSRSKIKEREEKNLQGKIFEKDFVNLLCDEYLNCDFDTGRYIVRSITDAIIDCTVNGVDVSIPNFGVFYLANRKRRYYDLMKHIVVENEKDPLVTLKFKCSPTLKASMRKLVAEIEAGRDNEQENN